MEYPNGDMLSMGKVNIKHRAASKANQMNKVLLFSMLNTPFFAIRYNGKPILIKLSYNIINDIILILENKGN